jgi:hypothetical protein
MAMAVHIVGTPRDAKQGPPLSLCGAKVDGFYVRSVIANPIRRLCGACLAAHEVARKLRAPSSTPPTQNR